MPESEPSVCARENFTEIIRDLASKILVKGMSPKSVSDMLELANDLGITHKGKKISIDFKGASIERVGSRLMIAQGATKEYYRDSQLNTACETLTAWVYNS